MGYGIVEYKWREADLQGRTLATVGVQKKEQFTDKTQRKDKVNTKATLNTVPMYGK